MFDSDTILNRRSYLQATGATALATAGLAGCVGQATGTLATKVTDQPADIADFESLVVTIEGIWLGPEGAESGASANETETETDDSEGGTSDGGNETADGDGTDADEDDDETDPSGREYHEFDAAKEADLVQLQGGETKLIDERELSVGTYQFLQLDVSNVDGTLNDGSEATVDLPGNAPLTFNEEFDVRENTRTIFTADFAPVSRGTGDYLLRPVPRGIDVTYETDGESGGDNSSDAE